MAYQRLIVALSALFAFAMPPSLHGAEPTKTGPAKVEGAVKESELATITLTPQAEQRLGIQTSVVREEEVQHSQVFGGEVIVPQGQSAVVTAPLTGRIMSPEGGGINAGARVAPGQTIFRLWPVLGAEREVLSPSDRIARMRAEIDIEAARVDVEGQATKAQVAVDAAKVKVNRAEELVQRNAGSDRALEEARAELQTAEATLSAAQRRLAFLQGTTVDSVAANIPMLSIESPLEGVLQHISAAEHQTVSSGTPLFTVANLTRIWVRVPVYVGALGSQTAESATVTIPGAQTSSQPIVARRVFPQASGNSAAATVDYFYEFENPNLQFRPGQRVLVTMTTAAKSKRMVVPWSAVVYDIHGGAWVYENVKPQTFTRRRIELERVYENNAILRRGVEKGIAVVTSGVAELYGTEFGVGK